MTEFWRLALFLLVFGLFLNTVLAVIPSHSTKIFAVTNDGEGLEAELSLRIESGTGKVFSGVDALVGTSTQNAFKVALDVAKNYVTIVDNYDYYFEIKSSASIVDGPSAGSATAVLLVSMLQNNELPQTVAMTGTVSENGSIGTVGGVFEKSRVASESGIELFMIPRGEARQVARTPNGIESVNLIEYAPREWGIKIIEVDTIDDALELAFSDIASIDVQQHIDASEELFIPESIPFHPKLEPLHDITEDYLQQAQTRLEEARNALNTTILSDNQLVSVMFDSLVESETVLEDAQNLYDQNFLYSAANSAFTAVVNAMIVKDIAQNPSILNENSTLFESKLEQLQLELSLQKMRLNGRILVDQVDWQIAAQQRWLWAQNNVHELLTTQTIVIQTDGINGVNTVQLDKLRDYEFAMAWKEIAEVFSLELQNATVQIQEIQSFRTIAEQELVKAENLLPLIGLDERVDIQRRFDGAKTAQSLDWFLPMAADASSVSFLIQAEEQMDGKGLPELEELLNQKIMGLDQKVGEEKPFVWARIYLDHARYFQQAIQYYKEKNRTSQAVNAAKSGVSVVFLAESAFESHEQIYNQINQLPTVPFDPEPFVPPTGFEWNDWWTIAFVLIFLLAIIIVWLLFQLRKHKKMGAGEPISSKSLREQSREFVRQSAELDRKLVQGKLSHEAYFKKRDELFERFSHVRAQQLSTPTGHLAELGTRIKVLEKDLRELRKSLNRGEVSQPEFVERFEEVQRRLKENQGELEKSRVLVSKGFSPLPSSNLPVIQKAGLPSKTKPSQVLQDIAKEIKKPVKKSQSKKKRTRK
ncbi:hypothetical protein KKE06_05380 [Candidatus Micrarchaeota archaeon]|nr:hypothetical protein [Candidatus Micrarchaeota archaeon]MBU1930168.1 hypothetical protein [Candidatus Micrarchaeota archaeon]